MKCREKGTRTFSHKILILVGIWEKVRVPFSLQISICLKKKGDFVLKKIIIIILIILIIAGAIMGYLLLKNNSSDDNRTYYCKFK